MPGASRPRSRGLRAWRARDRDRRVGGRHAARRRRCRPTASRTACTTFRRRTSRRRAARAARAVHYVALDDGAGRGPGQPTVDATKPFTAAPTVHAKLAARGPTRRRHRRRRAGRGAGAERDSVFTELEVDSAVVRSQLQRGAGLSARLAGEARRGHGARPLRRGHDRLRRHGVVHGRSGRRIRDSLARCAMRCRTCAFHRRRSARRKCVSSSSSRSRSRSRRSMASGAKP